VPLTDAIPELQKNVLRWTEEVSSEKTRVTLLQGIAGKAVNGFENVLRESLGHCLDLCELSYAFELASDFDEKPLDKLTLGEVVQSFDKLDTKFTHYLRSRCTVTGHLIGTKRLIGKTHKERLGKITKIRNILHHHLEKFGQNESTIKENTKGLLSLIQQELSGPLFQIVMQRGP